CVGSSSRQPRYSRLLRQKKVPKEKATPCLAGCAGAFAPANRTGRLGTRFAQTAKPDFPDPTAFRSASQKGNRYTERLLSFLSIYCELLPTFRTTLPHHPVALAYASAADWGR